MDKAKRRGQAYGPGEYFSKDPSISVSYCHGGHSMVVFVVAAPPQRPGTPPDYVVVENNTHQYPLGVMKFGKVDHDTMQRSNTMRATLKHFSQELQKKESVVIEAQTKAYIIQLIIQDKIDMANEKYVKYRSMLKVESLQEISMYVRDRVDKDVVDVLFPELPPPYKSDEFVSQTNLSTVEAYEQHAVEAKQDLDKFQSQWESSSYNPGAAGNP